MVRRSLFLPVIAAVSGLLMAGWTAPASAAAPAPASAAAKAPLYTPALEVTLDSLSPSYLPAEGPVRVTGSVTNADDVPWVGVNIYGFLGTEPMLAQSELADAAESDPLSLVGNRITAEGSYATVGDLEPGEEAGFSLTIDRALLQPTVAGVYWFGVQALGESSDSPSDLVSDGRARTFLPYLPPATPGKVKTALVLPMRHYLPYDGDGSLEGLEHWARTLSVEGRLRDLVEFAASSGSTPVTWLVDPALPDAIRRLAMNNPPRSVAPTETVEEDEEPEGSPSGSPTETAEPDGQPEGREPSPETVAAAEAAAVWLGRFEEAVQGDQILTLPYGDLDVAAAAELDPDLYELARERPSSVLTDWGETTDKGVAAPSGYLNEAGFEIVSDDTTVMVTDRMFGDDPPGVADVDGKKVAVLSSGAAAGGPGPGDRFSSVQLRQRILSEAAVRLLSPGRHPLVVSLPLAWHPGDASAFFTGLDADWLDLTTVSDAIDRDGTVAVPAELDYPALQQRRQLDEPTFEAVRGLIAAGETLQNLLTLNSGVSASVTEQALAGASYGSRETPITARSALGRARDSIEKHLKSVKINAGPGVTLSGRDGGFAIVIQNDLDQPVTVNVLARSDGGVEIAPIEPVELAADSRSTVVLDAHANRVGVTNVTLQLTDVDGHLLGSSDQLPVRSAQVSVVIWLIIGTGLGLLFLAILVRLFRRIRRGAAVPPPPTVESS
ncbi:MAG: DUF6049 family protein [Actinomycetota bacterium]|nr:DUF6049 family protein [Actinomycetota bacterium]